MDKREPGERERIRIIEGTLFIDYACFKKTPAERLVLKIAKAKHKDYLRRKRN